MYLVWRWKNLKNDFAILYEFCCDVRGNDIDIFKILFLLNKSFKEI